MKFNNGLRMNPRIPRIPRISKSLANLIPHFDHIICSCWNCSTLSQCLFLHAHSFPLIPRTIITTNPITGMRQKKAIWVLFRNPHIQFRKNAPQFQRIISRGTSAVSPCPEVFSIFIFLTFSSASPCLFCKSEKKRHHPRKRCRF
jgi:hypothetical protein